VISLLNFTDNIYDGITDFFFYNYLMKLCNLLIAAGGMGEWTVCVLICVCVGGGGAVDCERLSEFTLRLACARFVDCCL